MEKPIMLRRRYIPYETVDISGDELLFRSNDILITKWNTIRPRSDFSAGISFIFLKEGFKISRFYDSTGKFLYWYCDIIDTEYIEENDTYLMKDLLLDIKITPEGYAKVLDADELADALEKGVITQEQACRSLKRLDLLLNMIYKGEFPPEICMKTEYWINSK
jgi:uncharacterized protein